MQKLEFLLKMIFIKKLQIHIIFTADTINIDIYSKSCGYQGYKEHASSYCLLNNYCIIISALVKRTPTHVDDSIDPSLEMLFTTYPYCLNKDKWTLYYF